MNIAVLFGGISSEHEISIRTGCFICKLLKEMGHRVKPILIEKSGTWKIPIQMEPKIPYEFQNELENFTELFLKNNTISENRNHCLEEDLFFIGLHGKGGEDGIIQGYLETISKPYTGSNVFSSSLAMNKNATNTILQNSDLKIPKFQMIPTSKLSKISENELERYISQLNFPVFLKPNEGGSSYLTFKLKSKQELLEKLIEYYLKEDALIQEYVSGTEVSCVVFDKKNGNSLESVALLPTEIRPKSDFFDFTAKYTKGGSEEITPPKLPPEMIKKIQDDSILAHKVLGCSGYSRTDFIYNEQGLFFLELNSLPGMTETSLIQQQAKASGFSMEEIFQHLLNNALDKFFKINKN